MNNIYILIFLYCNLILIYSINFDYEKLHIFIYTIISQIIYYIIIDVSSSVEERYFYAYLLDMSLILLFSNIGSSYLICDMIMINIISLITHITGYIFYWFYVPGSYYNYSTCFIFVIYTMRLLMNNKLYDIIKNNIINILGYIGNYICYKNMAKEKS